MAVSSASLPAAPALALSLIPAARAALDKWHAMAAARDFSDLADIAAEDVVFRSPVAFKPYPGRAALVAVIGAAMTVFEDFRYLRQFATPDGRGAVLEFEARIGDVALKGIDMIGFDGSGRIAEFEVMIRPGRAVLALGERMKELVGARLKALGIG